MKVITKITSLLASFSLCSCSSLAMLAGEKLGHLSKEPVGTSDSFEVVIQVKTKRGMQTQTRHVTRNIVGHKEIAGGVSPIYETISVPKGREFVFYSDSNKLVATMPYPQNLGGSEVLYMSSKMAKLHTCGIDTEWIRFSNLSKSTSMHKYGFQLISFKVTKAVSKIR